MTGRRSVHWWCDYATAVDIEVDPPCRRICRRESDFAHWTLVEGCAAKTELVRVVLRWHSCGSEVCFGLPVGL